MIKSIKNAKAYYSDTVIKKSGPLLFILREVKHLGFDGKQRSYNHSWGVLERGESVAVLVHKRSTDEVMLVEQFRPAVLKTLLELPAGVLDFEERPIDAAKRELKEESGISAESLTLISSFYTTPGGSSELMHVFYAAVEDFGREGIFGLSTESENIMKHTVKFEVAMKAVVSGEIEDAKTILALLWLQNKKA